MCKFPYSILIGMLYYRCNRNLHIGAPLLPWTAHHKFFTSSRKFDLCVSEQQKINLDVTLPDTMFYITIITEVVYVHNTYINKGCDAQGKRCPNSYKM